MKELTFDRNSWHYRLAAWAGYRPWEDGLDICVYTRKVIRGIFLIIVIFGLTYVFSYIMVDATFGIVFSIAAGMWLTGIIGTVALIIIGAMFIVAAATASIEYLRYWNDNRRKVLRARPPKPDGFVKQAYKSWKEKYCAKIKFIGDDS